MHRAIAMAAVVSGLGIERSIILLASIASVTYLAAIGVVPGEAPVAFLTLTIGYVFGASSPSAGKPPSPQ